MPVFTLFPENYLHIVLRLVLAVVFGGIIGIERSSTNHDAGMRTHVLVCLGATGVMILSETMHARYGGDIGRLGAQVISGIGFLGAGSILISGQRIKGLTTAAGLWATACVGLATGLGLYFTATVMIVLMLTAMLLLHPISTRIEKRTIKREFILRILLYSREDASKVMELIENENQKIFMAEHGEDHSLTIRLGGMTETALNNLICTMVKWPEIRRIERE